ncbi:MAG TPA: TaqI-like C-terminal specificity domain-containing protein [Chitinophagaceae bacterium]|nr:TaqI-like C-terminal specificity domain-containing protein [Chitinophagaceae bacterium]
MTDKDYDKLKQIEEAIQAFNSKKLYESSIALFKALDYQSNKTERISPNNFDGLVDSFSIPKNTINKEKALESHWQHIEFIFQVADSEITRVQSLFDTREVDRNEFQSFLFFTIQLKEESYKRSDLVKITRELNVPFKMPVIILFHYGTKITLSIIDRRLHKKDTSKDVLEKVTLIKDIDIANPQRAHKEILKDLSLNELYKKFEFHSFVKLHEAWKSTLNISELNKKFYKELAYWYFWALQEVEFPSDELNDDKTRNPVNVIRLITRLIFVWFLKEKNLIPDELFNKRELDKILDYKDKTGSTYYKAILQNLFFATLNTEMNKDVKDKNKISRTFVNRNTGVPHYFRYSKLIKDQAKFAKWMDNIPFLNGGLFECLDKRSKNKDIYIDGFTQQVKNEPIVTVPDYLFFSDAPQNIDLNNTFHTKGKKYEVRGLIDILSRYKFTIEENTPVEEEVALDPELLGKVFENLLASYNEETETTARKLTGSFYTPREIVNYMVDESLITYLCNSIVKEDDEKQQNALNEKLHHLFSYTVEEPQFIDAEKNQLIDAIDTCKILDPACGSGAFPMGILHKLVFILGKLDPNNKKWKQKQSDKAKRDKALAERMEDDKNRDAAIQEIDLRIKDIEKAFDQNNHELDFARKLYLIENCIYGVDKQPVAIQISKLRFFIALIVDQKTENNTEPNRGIRPLPNLETKFVAADTLVGLENRVQLTLIDPNLEKQIEEKEAEIHDVRERHFRARTPETKDKYRAKDEILRGELAKLLEQAGLFSPTNAKRIAYWNPYDQNKAADFFFKEWMFSLKVGFDIVIGNPPYIEHKKLKSISSVLKEQYETYSGTADIYVYFYEKGIKLLAENGVLSYITSNKFIKTSYGEKLREFLVKRKVEQIIDFTEVHVFEALVSSCIVITSEAKSKNNVLVSFATDELTSFGNLNEFISCHNLLIEQKTLGKEIWQLQSMGNLDIKKKIESSGKLLSNIRGVNFYRGVTTGYNPAFIINDEIKRELIKANKINKSVIKPLIQGRNIKKWEIKNNGEYLLFIPWHFPLHENPEITGNSAKAEKALRENYPELYEHLKSHKPDLSKRNKDETGIRYEWYALQRCAASYYKEFDRDKIVWGLTADKWAFAYDDKKHYLPSNGYILTASNIDLKYLLSLLNSKLSQFYFSFIGIMTAGGAYTLKHETISEMPIVEGNEISRILFISIVDYILFLYEKEENESGKIEEFEKILNGCVYELYFGEEMKKAGVDILVLVEKDLEAVKKLSSDKAINKLYEKWQEPKNEVRNRLLLMTTRCPDTIGVIEASVS